MGIQGLLVEDEEGVRLPRRLPLSIVYLPCTGSRGDGLGDGIVGIDIRGKALQRGEHG